MDKSWIHGYMDIFFSPGVYLSIKQGYLSKKKISKEISMRYPRDIHEISKKISIYPCIHDLSRWISIGNMDMWISFGYLPHIWICKDMWICG
jgi:hypothetical protein